MDTDLTAVAGDRLESALAGAAIDDPRPYYRDHLRALRPRDPDSFARAVRVFEEEVIPRVADPECDPVVEWLNYGLRLADLTGAGRTMLIDADGRAIEAPQPPPTDRLALFLPEDAAAPVLPLVVPAQLSEAQRATFHLLVRGRTA